MTRPARALLDAQALRDNLERVREYAPQSKIMAVVKADAYGHGLAWAADKLRKADAFGVACIEEAIALRQAGSDKRICLLEGFFDAAELPAIAQHRLDPVIHHTAQLWDLEQAQHLRPLDVWLKVDTGMHRLGFPPEQAAEAWQHLRAAECVATVRVLSHFANADNKFDSNTRAQTERFLALTADWGLERSLANSAGVAGWADTHLEWVRPGIMLYGASSLAGHTAADLGLRPVMTLVSALIAVRKLKKGDAVGYGGEWVCPEDMPVGVVAIGYGDGYPRQMKAGAPVLVAGHPAPLIGRVSMDMITVDLRSQPHAKVGDPVVLWGRGLPVEDLAPHAGTIGYTLLCGVTARVPRVEIHGQG